MLQKIFGCLAPSPSHHDPIEQRRKRPRGALEQNGCALPVDPPQSGMQTEDADGGDEQISDARFTPNKFALPREARILLGNAPEDDRARKKLLKKIDRRKASGKYHYEEFYDLVKR